jgi:hypothetical protein
MKSKAEKNIFGAWKLQQNFVKKGLFLDQKRPKSATKIALAAKRRDEVKICRT